MQSWAFKACVEALAPSTLRVGKVALSTLAVDLGGSQDSDSICKAARTTKTLPSFNFFLAQIRLKVGCSSLDWSFLAA
jgi:hypothetical protein